MHRCGPKKILTRLITHLKLNWIRVLVSVGVILLVASCVLCTGQGRDFVPIACPMLSSTEEYCVNRLPEETKVDPINVSDREMRMLCQVVWGEARGCSREEQMLVVWCICNRVDATGASFEEVITAPYQFHGYSGEHPVTRDIYSTVKEVLVAYSKGQAALIWEPFSTDSDYLYFSGRDGHNYFRKEW